jgi:hypothetical protein
MGIGVLAVCDRLGARPSIGLGGDISDLHGFPPVWSL